ncbi:MAG: hypothetical protein HY288_19470 [Planctomycetia bacterium]|nr:hypothetical protein [Planctomycetia bacterium]
MRKRLWIALLALPMAVAGGLVYAKAQQVSAESYVCPLSGEELPCPHCCPLNHGK